MLSYFAHRSIADEPGMIWPEPEEIGFVLLRRRDWRWLGLRSRVERIPVYREPTITVMLTTGSYTLDSWPDGDEVGHPTC